MIVAVVSKNMLYKNRLSDTPNGDYQIKDYFNNIIGNLNYVNSSLQFSSNNNYEIITDKGFVKTIAISNSTVFKVKNRFEQFELIVYIYPSRVDNSLELKPKKNKIVIGKSNDCDIVYNCPLLKNHAFSLLYDRNMWFLETLDDYVYINDSLVKRKRVDHGDVIFAGGLKLFCLGDTIVVTSLLSFYKVQINDGVFDKKVPISQEIRDGMFDIEDDKEVFSDDKFQRSPRFRTSVKEYTIDFAAPPKSGSLKETPLILTLGPQLTLLITSGVNIFSSLSSVASGRSNLSSVVPSLILSVVMLISSFLWPSLTRRYQKKEQAKLRLKNVKKYRQYLTKKEKEINDLISEQKQILIENNVSLEDCQQIIFRRKRNLWERTIFDDDFLSVRVGTGLIPPYINFNYKKNDFGIDEDSLSMELDDLIKRVSYVDNVPVNTSLVENRITAFIGNPANLRLFMESILLQIATFHIYSELKIIVFTDNTKIHDWDYLKYLPHCWDNQRTTRFICADNDSKKKICSYLDSVIKERKGSLSDNGNEEENLYTKFSPYFLIITDNVNDSKQYEAFNDILNLSQNLGFSVIIKNNRIANLPSQCSTFINIDNENSGLFKNDLDEKNQLHFSADLNTTINVEDCFRELANIYVDVPLDKHELPKSVGFLSMYEVGNVEQLNSADRWVQNNPVNSLSVPVGIDQSGNLFNFDIHEKAYGPHGLVAGTTGSGKSEWLITYILSLCVNFSPEEVQFVLIDYKGGGLAGSFDNKETGMHLPHLVGTITNLDKSEIRRSLASLDAESKRRQRMFNEAREKLNDSSMNIYKYQQYYRKGMLDEPLSHLFIISDEFAELKAQEPEFLSQLVSIARIGRSLGIHLILATQKPSGIVDDQIYSNSKFKICLRVQDKSDSKDMINVDDAAYLHQTGAFYMLVGLDEVFALGQSAYAGGLYKPTQIVKKDIDTSLTILSQSGEQIDSVDYVVKDNNALFKDVHGEELLNIILYVSNISNNLNMKIRKLWLEAMPEIIYVDNLKKKFNSERLPFVINPIIGEYDDPYNQTQELLQLNINLGNIFITGISGSGKEQLLQTMIYSIITTYTPQEVNIYICDFGAETLAMFKESPHVGGITYMSETERIKNTIRFANKMFNLRKKKYREFGGSYESNIKYSQVKDPIILIIINSVENLKENMPDEFDELSLLLKECAKYGIVFVFSSTNSSILRGKLADSFPQVLTTKIANDEYSDVLGKSAQGIIPKNLKGRGLLNIDKVCYEYQTASIYEADKLQSLIKNVNTTLNNYYKIKALPLPMIPNTIDIDVIPKEKLSFNNICVGYGKSSIEPIYMDLRTNFGTLIIAPKKFNLTEYCKTLYKEFELLSNDNDRVYLFDPNETMKNQRYKNITYVDSSECQNTFNNLRIFVNQEYEKFNKLEDKSTYKAVRRSLIVFHECSACFNAFKGMDDFDKLIDQIRELELFDFVICDVMADYKDIYRDKGLAKLTMDSHGVLLGNVYDNQMFIDLNTRDIRQREALPENEGYVVKNGNGYLSQMLEFTKKEDSDEV